MKVKKMLIKLDAYQVRVLHRYLNIYLEQYIKHRTMPEMVQDNLLYEWLHRYFEKLLMGALRPGFLKIKMARSEAMAIREALYCFDPVGDEQMAIRGIIDMLDKLIVNSEQIYLQYSAKL